MSIALRQSQMDIFDFISLFSGQKPRSYSTRRILRQAGTLVLLPCTYSPFPLVNSGLPERPLDGEDRSGIMRREGGRMESVCVSNSLRSSRK